LQGITWQGEVDDGGLIDPRAKNTVAAYGDGLVHVGSASALWRVNTTATFSKDAGSWSSPALVYPLWQPIRLHCPGMRPEATADSSALRCRAACLAKTTNNCSLWQFKPGVGCLLGDCTVGGVTGTAGCTVEGSSSGWSGERKQPGGYAVAQTLQGPDGGGRARRVGVVFEKTRNILTAPGSTASIAISTFDGPDIM
jgi:hypothetical protein